MGCSLLQLIEGLTQENNITDVEVMGIENHSSRVKSGDLYLAVQGIQSHGLDYLPEAIERGACAVAWHGASALIEHCKIPTIQVAGLPNKMGVIADRFFGHPSQAMEVIAVTGTDGKSSVSHFIAEALSMPNNDCGLIGTLGYGYLGRLQTSGHTTPDALQMHKILYKFQQNQTAQVVIEASSHGLEQGRMNGVAVDVAVFTNLGDDHSDYHGSQANYAAAKRRLFEFGSLKTAVINIDDAFGASLPVACHKGVSVLTYSTKSSSADAHLLEAQMKPQGLAVTASVLGKRVELETTLFGEFNTYNLLAAMLVLHSQGLSVDNIMKCLGGVHTVRGRMQRLGGNGAPVVFIDYAHTPQALEQALISCRHYTTGRLFCVFGCGGNRDRSKRAIMGQVAEHYADEVVVCDDNPRHEDPDVIFADILTGMREGPNVKLIHNRARAIESTIRNADQDDVVLVAGKGHETYQLIGNEKKVFDDVDYVQKVCKRY